MNAMNELERNRTTISLSKENYEKLSRLGFAGESFNELISRLIDLALEANKREVEED
jgi:predicted CopG family antitoxin